MISNRIRKAIQTSVFAAGAALGAGTAQAAAYTGTWDPAFSPTFPTLGWKGWATFYIPDACLLSPDGWINNTAACSGGEMKITKGHVDFYKLNPVNADDTSQVIDKKDFDLSLLPVVTRMEVKGNNLKGIDGGFLLPWTPNLTSLGISSSTHFWLAFAGGPEMFYVTCANLDGKKKNATVLPFPTAGTSPTGWVNSNFNGECGNDVSPYGWSSSDQPGGAAGPLDWSTSGSLTRDGATQVPEPASIALVLSALGAGWVARRRRAS